MRLWTEYEGETIDGAFPLKSLLLPEGRSAFFATANSHGDPAMLRLIECHFDEEEILARWRCVEALNHPNFLRLERYGQIELDGGPAVYALFEKADANLGQVLSEGTLGVKDAAQIAASLVAALDMLHTHGFVHDHVAPENVYAVGDLVKLRSDCIREAPEGHAGVEAKQRDVRDLAVLMFQTLAPHDRDIAQGTSALPVPFDKLVRNGLNGTWGLSEMRAAVEDRARPIPSGSAPASPVPASTVSDRKPVTSSAAAPRETAPAQKPASSPAPRGKVTSEDAGDYKWRGNFAGSSIRQRVSSPVSATPFSLRSIATSKWTGIAAMLVVLLLMGRLVQHEWREARNPAATATAVSPKTMPVHARAAGLRAGAGTVAPRHDAGTLARSQWRVVTYTYNRADQAQKKAAALARSHPNLHPQVFTPSGHRPYLVTVGGILDREQAYALARELRGRGLPRDTYAQNYSPRAD